MPAMQRTDSLSFIENPISAPLMRTAAMFSQLVWSPSSWLPSMVSGFALGLVSLALVLIWPYGLVPVIAHYLWALVDQTVKALRAETTYFQKMPHTIALGIYFIIWLPFGIACLPFLAIGFLGEKLLE